MELRGTGTWRRRLAVALFGASALLAVGALTGVGAGAQETPAAPMMVVRPNSGLADGDEVEVEALGLTAGMTVFIGIVNPDPSLGEGLARVVLLPEGDPAATTGFEVDESGRLRVTLPVIAGQVGTNPRSTCPPSPEQQARGFEYCRMFISAAEDPTDTVQVDIGYVGQDPPPPPGATTTTTAAPTTTTTTTAPPTTTTAPPPSELASTGDATPALAVVACALLGFGIIAVHVRDDRPAHRRR